MPTWICATCGPVPAGAIRHLDHNSPHGHERHRECGSSAGLDWTKKEHDMSATPTVTKDPGGWYEIDGLPSWHGSDHPGYLRAIIRTSGATEQGQRARAVLAYVERNTPWYVRAWRNWRAQG